jgi:DNA-binding protein Alba
MDERQIFVGKKPVHLYVRAVVMAMEAGDRLVRLTARGAAIGNAVDTAELCRRRHGNIAASLPEAVHVRSVDIATEMTERRDGGGERGVSVIHIVLEGVGDVPAQDEEE